MEQSGAHRRLQSGLLNHSDTVSFASSSAHGSSFSPHPEYLRIVKPLIMHNKQKILHVEQGPKTNVHKPSLAESYHPAPFNNNYGESDNETTNKDHYDRVNGPRHHLFKPGIENSSDKKTAVWTVTARHKEKGLSKIRAQSLNQNHESIKWPHSHGDISAIPLPSPPSVMTTVGSEANSAQHLKHTHNAFKKVVNQTSPKIQAQSSVSNPEGPFTISFSHPNTANNLSQQESEISPKLFAKYKTNSGKVEYISHQRTAPMPGRLHKSQSGITIASRLRKQKSASELDLSKQSFEHRFEPENVKMKVKSLWNSIRYGWTLKSKSSFKYDSPLFMLGKCYHRRENDPSTEQEDQFLKDFASRIWLTYRSNFYPIPGTKLNTDCGWGCMLRSGQMLIAQCLVTHFLGRDWRLYNKQTDADSVFYREIIRWFSDPLDTPSDKTPFCLHHLANFGRAHNKDPGEWYGPASVAYIFRDAFITASHSVPVLNQLCLYVAQDCTVFIEDVMNLCTEKHTSGSLSNSVECDARASGSNQEVQQEKWQRSLIILIPMRLGGEVTNEIYIPCVQNLLSHTNCMGIIGGRPKHSLYFLGWQDRKLIYLDPHLCREAVDTTVSDFRIETFHCMTPRKLAISKMDPSCSVGFYIQDAAEFRKFVQEVKEFIAPEQKGMYPLFTFSDGRQCDSVASHNHTAADRRVRVTHYRVDQHGQKTFSGESEEFVVL